MNKLKIEFVVGGRFAKIILGGWHHAGVELAEVRVFEPTNPGV